jgi:hypothetical protein
LGRLDGFVRRKLGRRGSYAIALIAPGVYLDDSKKPSLRYLSGRAMVPPSSRSLPAEGDSICLRG